MVESDLLVHPARVTAEGDVEGVPNVIVEAHATGLPIVATFHGGIPEVVVPGETGELVAERDPEALAGALRPLIENQQMRLTYGAAAYRRTEVQFNADQREFGSFASPWRDDRRPTPICSLAIRYFAQLADFSR